MHIVHIQSQTYTKLVSDQPKLHRETLSQTNNQTKSTLQISVFYIKEVRPLILSVIANMLGFKTGIGFGFMCIPSVSLTF